MFKPLPVASSLLFRLLLFTVLFSLLVVLAALSTIPISRDKSAGPAANANIQKPVRQAPDNSMPSLQGAQASQYLEERGEYQSLMEAVTATRFGLKHYDHSPVGNETDGYLGMSHEQNLNAWFDDQGITIRPTL